MCEADGQRTAIRLYALQSLQRFVDVARSVARDSLRQMLAQHRRAQSDFRSTHLTPSEKSPTSKATSNRQKHSMSYMQRVMQVQSRSGLIVIGSFGLANGTCGWCSLNKKSRKVASKDTFFPAEFRRTGWHPSRKTAAKSWVKVPDRTSVLYGLRPKCPQARLSRAAFDVKRD